MPNSSHPPRRASAAPADLMPKGPSSSRFKVHKALAADHGQVTSNAARSTAATDSNGYRVRVDTGCASASPRAERRWTHHPYPKLRYRQNLVKLTGEDGCYNVSNRPFAG